MIWLLAACGPTPGQPLVTFEAWTPDLAADPVPAHQTDAGCDSVGWEEELGGLEIKTGDCPYAVFSQPLLAPVRSGWEAEFLAWHNDLVAPEPAEAHLVLAIDGDVVFDEISPIPSDAFVWDELLVFDEDYDAGVPVVLHLHNHGANTWNINRLRVPE